MVIGTKPVGMFGIGALGIIETSATMGALINADALNGIYEPCSDESRQSSHTHPKGPFFARGPNFWGGNGGALSERDPLAKKASVIQSDHMRVVGLMWQHAPLSYELKKTRDTIARSFLEIYKGSVYKDGQMVGNGDIGKLIQKFWYTLMCAPRDVGTDEDVLAITHFIAYGLANTVDPALQIDMGSYQVSTKQLTKLTAMFPSELELICGFFRAHIAKRFSDMAERKTVELHPFVRTHMNVIAESSEVAVEHHVATAILDLRDEGHLPSGLGHAHDSEINEVEKMQDIFWKELDNPFERNISIYKLKEFVRGILRSDPSIGDKFSSMMLENLVSLAVLTIEHRVGLDTSEANRILRPNPDGGPTKALTSWVRGFVEEIHSKPKEETHASRLSSEPPPPAI